MGVFGLLLVFGLEGVRMSDGGYIVLEILRKDYGVPWRG
jgi:hypothetical protein